MFEKDYLMRLIQTLLDAIHQITNSIDKEDIEGAKMQLSTSYRLLGNEEDYFTKTGFKELIIFFKLKNENYLKSVEILAKLIYLAATIDENKAAKFEKLEKSKNLFQHYNQFSKEYSFEINNKLVLIKKELDTLKH